MSDYEAVSALLMLGQSHQIPSNVPSQQLLQSTAEAYGFYNDNQENGPQDLSLVKNNPRQGNTSTPLKPINGQTESNAFSLIDHNYNTGLQNRDTEETIDLNRIRFNETTNNASSSNTPIDRSDILPAPSLPTWVSGDPHVNLPEVVCNEFDKIVRHSNHAKEEFLQRKSQEIPTELKYNPNKSRLRKEYKDAAEAEDRAKNNLASRRSRQKKKTQMQMLNFSLTFDREENRELFAQERWMSDFVSEFETKLLARGYDVAALKSLRAQCGLR